MHPPEISTHLAAGRRREIARDVASARRRHRPHRARRMIDTAVVLVVAALALGGAAVARAVPANDGTDLQTSGATAISPDGRWAVWTRTQAGNTDVWLSSVTGGQVRRLTTDPAVDMDPTWSPDGRALVFVSYRSGGGDLYAIGADGTGERRVTSDPGAEDQPVVSPDGRTVAFRRTGSGSAEVDLASLDGGGERPLAPGLSFQGDPAFSPDGTQVALTAMSGGVQEVYVVATAGGPARRLTFDAGADYLPSFTPDGRSVRFMRVRPGGYDFLQVPLDGSRPPRPWWTGPRRPRGLRQAGRHVRALARRPSRG